MTNTNTVPNSELNVLKKEFDPLTAIALIEQRVVRGLAKAISFVEDGGPDKATIMEYAYKKKSASTLVIGITGPGGAGKSTLVGQMISYYRSQGKTVGVIAVDPSSPYTGGAFLGDRVRMSTHNSDNGVFIRSFGTRNSLGGISEAVKGALYLYKAFHFDIIIVESIGVGQDQTEIDSFVDVTAVLFVPGFGDSIQMAKAGIKEVADVFIINKADKPEALILKEQMMNSFGIMPEESRPPVVCTIANAGKGIDEAVRAIEFASTKNGMYIDNKRRSRIWAEIRSSVMHDISEKLETKMDQMVERVFSGVMTPYEAAQKIVESIKIEEN